MVLYIPTYVSLVSGAWTIERNAHGPLILAAILFAFWKHREQLPLIMIRPRPVFGGMVFGTGLLLYILGRSQDILIFEVGSQIPVLAGLFLILMGGEAVRKFWFPILFILFLIPIPGVLVDFLTVPLKHYVSIVVDDLLYWFGYPIARDGVVMTIGPYQMLIADACSGLNSMYSLSALGVLYIYLRGHAGWLQNSVLILSVLPVALLANIGRVILLIMVTYYYGDAAGRGFVHDFSGISEVVLALSVLLMLDALLSITNRSTAD